MEGPGPLKPFERKKHSYYGNLASASRSFEIAMHADRRSEFGSDVAISIFNVTKTPLITQLLLFSWDILQ